MPTGGSRGGRLPPVRVLYTDVDGTLVGPLGNLLWNGSRIPTLAAAEALVRAAREGLEIVPLTGRSRATMSELCRVLGLPSWICELGAIRVYERGEEVVRDHGAFPGEGSPAGELAHAAKRLVDVFLKKEFKTGMDSKMLLARYQELAEHPYIFRDDDKTFNVPGFNHLHYAGTRSAEICAGKKK